jgi:aldehyde:ferredoxin oxidoreductase
METCLDRFYEACGFDSQKAIPTLEKYQELGMMGVAEAVYQVA